MKIGVQFLSYADETTSKVYGPYDSLQVTYDVLRSDDDDEIASFTNDRWMAPDKVFYSDFVVAAWDSEWSEPDKKEG
jgi:hypothetical protein